MLKLILFVLPRGLDTFAVAAPLGMRCLPPRQRLRISLMMSGYRPVLDASSQPAGHDPVTHSLKARP